MNCLAFSKSRRQSVQNWDLAILTVPAFDNDAVASLANHALVVVLVHVVVVVVVVVDLVELFWT